MAEGPHHRLDEVSFDLTPDGATLVTGWRRTGSPTELAVGLVAIDVESGERRTRASGEAEHEGVRCSPDGRWAVCVRGAIGDPERAHHVTLWLVDLASGEGRDLTPGLDLWPLGPAWAPDSRAVFFVADEGGRSPVFRVDVSTGAVTRLSAAGTFSDLCPSPDGSAVYALRSTVSSPPEAVVQIGRAHV